MGYFLKSGDGSAPDATVSITDEEWMALTDHASRGGYSAPHLRMLEVGEEPVRIGDDEARKLWDALQRALHTTLVDTPTIDPDALDRDTVHRVKHVLRSGAVTLARSPRWRAGD